MKATYNTGIDSNQITLGVTVGTVGTAYTAVYLAISDDDQTLIAESNEDSGNISERNIGNSATLRTKFLVIRTTIDFSNIAPALWPGQIEHLSIQYHLNGGFAGSTVFKLDADDVVSSPEGKTIVITKALEFI